MFNVNSISGEKEYMSTINKNNEISYINSLSSIDQIDKDLRLIYLAFDICIDEAYVKIEKFKRYLRNIKFHTIAA